MINREEKSYSIPNISLASYFEKLNYIEEMEEKALLDDAIIECKSLALSHADLSGAYVLWAHLQEKRAKTNNAELSRSDVEEIIAIYAQLLALDANNKKALKKRASLYKSIGETEQAKADIIKALSVSQDFEKFQNWYFQRLQKFVIPWVKRKFSENSALLYLIKSPTSSPDNALTRSSFDAFLGVKAQEVCASTTLSIYHFERALQQFEYDIVALTQRGHSYLMHKNDDAMLQDLNYVIAEFGYNEAYFYRAVHYHAQMQNTLAKNDFIHCLTMSDGEDTALLDEIKAVILCLVNDVPARILKTEISDEKLTLKKYRSEAKNFIKKRDYKKAILALTRAIEIDLTSAELYRQIADLHVKEGHFSAADLNYSIAIWLSKGNGKLQVELYCERAHTKLNLQQIHFANIDLKYAIITSKVIASNAVAVFNFVKECIKLSREAFIKKDYDLAYEYITTAEEYESSLTLDLSLERADIEMAKHKFVRAASTLLQARNFYPHDKRVVKALDVLAKRASSSTHILNRLANNPKPVSLPATPDPKKRDKSKKITQTFPNTAEYTQRKKPSAPPTNYAELTQVPLDQREYRYDMLAIEKIIFDRVKRYNVKEKTDYHVLIGGGSMHTRVREKYFQGTPSDTPHPLYYDIDLIHNLPCTILPDIFSDYNIHPALYADGLFQLCTFDPVRNNVKVDFYYEDNLDPEAIVKKRHWGYLLGTEESKVLNPTGTAITYLVERKLVPEMPLETIFKGQGATRIPLLIKTSTKYDLTIDANYHRQMLLEKHLLLSNEIDASQLNQQLKKLFAHGMAVINLGRLEEFELLPLFFPKIIELLRKEKSWLEHRMIEINHYDSPKLAFVYANFILCAVMHQLDALTSGKNNLVLKDIMPQCLAVIKDSSLFEDAFAFLDLPAEVYFKKAFKSWKAYHIEAHELAVIADNTAEVSAPNFRLK